MGANLSRVAFGTLGKRIVAYLVLIAAAVVAFKLLSMVLFGLLQAVFMIGLALLVVVGVVWALRHL